MTKAKGLLEQKLFDIEKRLQQEIETNTVLWAESNAIKLQLDKAGSTVVDTAQQIAHLEAALRAAKDEINQHIKALTVLTTTHTAAERRIADMERDRVSHTEEMSGMMTMVEVTSALRSQADKRVLVLEEQHRQDVEALRLLQKQIEEMEDDKADVSKKLRTMAAQMQRDEKVVPLSTLLIHQHYNQFMPVHHLLFNVPILMHTRIWQLCVLSGTEVNSKTPTNTKMRFENPTSESIKWEY